MPTRRTFLAGGAAAGAALTVGRPGPAASTPSGSGQQTCDVVVVGAGLSGLAAARAVQRAGGTVVVVEARDRVGGKTFTLDADGTQVDLGAQFVGPTQDRVLSLIAELGIQTYPTPTDGLSVYVRKGIRTEYTGPLPPELLGLPDAIKALIQLDEMAGQVPRDRPWTAERAAEWDGQTFETWKRDNIVTEGGRFLVDAIASTLVSAHPRELSLLHLLAYISAAGNETTPGSLDRLTSVEGGAQERQLVGGTQQLAQRLAAELGPAVLLNFPARRVEHGPGRVDVFDGLGGQVTAREAIIAVPVALTSAIDFSPALPPDRSSLGQRMPIGAGFKLQVVYPEPFWRSTGLNGEALGDLDAVQVVIDGTRPGQGPGILSAFIDADRAKHWSRRDPASRRRAVVDDLTRYFGFDAARPRAYRELNWTAEPWSRGNPVGLPQPGTLLALGPALRASLGRLHWAGADVAEIWTGYLEGAIRSGERAAELALSG